MNQRISVNNNQQLLLMYQFIADRIDNDVFVKDINGVYVIANACFINKIRALGLIGCEVETVEGLTDFDIFNYDIAEQFSKDDAHVVESKEFLLKEEKVKHSNNLVKLFITRKEPIVDEQGNVIAIYGNSIEVAGIKRANKHVYLSAREMECLACVYYGKSATESGEMLGLSKRTVQYYIENIKNKLDCRTRAEMIQMVFSKQLDKALSYYYKQI